jgi:hypothetical protein
MSIRKAIYDLLNDSEADVYPLVAPQALTDPYVVFSMRRVPTRTQDGITVNDVELTLNIYANTLSDCISLADTMNAGIEAATGTYDTETLLIGNWVSEDGGYIDDLDKYIITQEYQLRFT